MTTTSFRLLFLICFISQTALAQFPSLQKDAVISILTVGPGNNLNDSFGHMREKNIEFLVFVLINLLVRSTRSRRFSQGE